MINEIEDKNNRRNLYEALKGDFDLGTAEQFEKSMQSAEARKNLWYAIHEDYDVGTFEQFEKDMMGDKVKPEQANHSQPTNAQPNQPQPQQAQFQQSLPITSKVGQTEQGNKQIAQVHNQQSSSQAMPPQATMNAPQPRQKVMSLNDRQKLWTWRNIKPTLSTGQTEQQYNARWNNEVENVKRRNDPDEIAAFNAFQKELAQQQAKVQQQGHAVVETGNQPFQSESGTEVWPISFSRKTIPHNQDYVFTLRAMQQAKGTYDLQYNIKDPEIRRDYEALTAPTDDTYRPTDAILDASPREKNKYYQWYAAYLYSNGGEMPEWLDYTAQLKLRSLNKSNLESEAKQWTNLVERTRNARKFRGSNSVSDWLNEQYNFKSGDPRIINGASYPYLVTRAGLIQTPLVQTTGRATVADNRRAYNELLQSNEQSKANPAQGDVYSTSNIINPERFWANTTKWQDLSESQKAAYKDEADYYNQMLKGQANVGYYNVGNGQNEEVEFLKHNRKQMNEQYNMLTDKERTQAVMKQAERTLNVLNGISHNLNTKLRFSIMGKGVEEDNGIRSVIRRYEKFLEVAPRYLEKRNYSAALQFWNGLTDLNGLTFGLLGVADAVSLNKIANNPPKDLIEKFGGEANAKKVIATAIQLDNMAEEYRQKLDYYGTGYSLGGLTQFGIQAGLPLFKGTEAVGKILTGGMRGLVKKATLRYMPNTAKRLGAKELVQATLAEGTRQAMREGGIGGAAGYVAGRLGVANGVSTIVGKAAQGSVEGVVLSVPHAIANVTNNRTGQANVVEINREGIKVNDQPFTHMNQAPDGKVEADTMLREWSQWVGMRVGEVFMPFSKYVDGKVANVAKGAWNKSVGRFIDGSSFARITETFSKAANVGKAATEVGKYVSGNLKRAGMGGTLTFYAQTNLSEMLNAMTVGDVSWDDIKSDQLDKLWGAFVSNAYLVAQNNLVGTVGYYNQKINLNKSLAQYDAQGSAAWGETDWNGIKADVDRLIDNDKNLQAYQNGVLANENLSKPQRETISQYIATRKTLQAFDLFAKVGNEKSKPNEFDIRYNDAYIAGTQVKSPDQMAQMRESLDASRNTLANLLGIRPEQVDALFADTNKSLGQIYEELTQQFVDNEKANLPNGQSVNTTNIEPIKRAIDHYCTALSMQRGVSESLITSQLEAVQKLDAKVDAATNKDSGMIERATDDMGRECYVISGNADSSNNTDMVVVRYTEDGRVASLSPKQVTIIQQTDAHELKQKNADLVDLNYEGILNSIVNGKTLPEPNDQVVLYDGKSRGVATIEGIKYEESTKDDTHGVAAQPKSVVVKTEDGRIIELPIDTYRQWVRDGFKHDTEVYVHGTESDNSENTNEPTEGTENATEAPTIAEGLRVSINGNEYTIGKVDDSRVELIDENGKDFHWTRSALDKKLKSGDAEILASNEENTQQKPELHYGDEVELNDPDNGENIRGKVNSRDASDEVEIVTDDGRVLRYSKRELDNVIQNVYNNGEHIWSKDENKTEEASNETDTEQEPQPIGKGVFGNIYDQFKGKVKAAFDFLMKHKSGDLLGVFHRDEVGDIDLVWGNENGGLSHIITKHVGEGKDFETPEKAIEKIEEVLKDGEVIQNGQMRYVVSKDGYRVAIRKDFDGEKKNWVVTAIDYNRTKEEKGIATNPTSASHGVNGSELAAPNNSFADKVTEQSATAQAEATQNEPMPMHTVGKGKNAVLTEDWLTTTPKRGFDYIFSESGLDAEKGREFVNNKLAEAQKNLDKVKNGKPKMGTSIAAYKEAKEAYTTHVEDAQKAVDYWQSVKAEHDKVLLAERHARDEKDKALHEQAVAEEQQRMQDDARKATEQAELGSNAVAPTIRDKWNAAKKENGDADEITLPNGEVVKGHYVLTESGAASASHQATNGFAETEGFPIDENGQSVNDRDYKRDQEAQQVTRSMATDYDQRALQSPVVVSQEGVVLSGNGRTMAGELAAQDGTDTKYVDYLHSHANKFGFTPEQVNGFKHPRVVFVPNEAMPYNADTFAKFNQREQKSQNNTEMAVKMGKVVNDALFGRIMDMVSKYDTLGDFYADDNATYAVVKQLAEADIIPQTEMAHLFDGGKLSEAGQSMIEGVMIGKVFQANPDAVRQITEVKSMRQAVMTALQDIVQNNRLGGGYNLSNELAEAVNLVYRARKAGYKLGQHVSDFAHQGNLFEYDEGATVADFNNMAVMMLADVLNDGRSTQLKKVIAFYNEQATDAAQGIGDMFVGGVKSKTEIINEVNKALNNGREYNTTATSLADGQGQRNQSSEQGNVVGTSDTDGKPTNDTSAVTAETNVESGATEGEKSSAMGDVVPSGEGDSPLSEKIATASAEVNTEPTEAQKEAGNYKKGHVQVGTFDITIEQPQGSVRKGTDTNGKQWESKMNNTYGYIRGAVGVDGDHIDVFLSNDIDGWNGRKVFVVDQYNPDGSFDEHKVMLGFNDADEAKSDYLANYENGWENGRRIDVTAVNLEDFEKWIASSKRKTKPFGEYSSVKNGVVPSGEGKSVERNEVLEYEKALDHLEDVEQKWGDKIQDYVFEHYPTQATTSAESTSEKGLQERKAMKVDPVLKQIYAEAKKEIDAADEMVTQKYSALPEDLRQQKVGGKPVQPPTREETILRDVVIDHMKESGLDVLGTEEGQQVLDMVNGRDVRLSAKQKRALETASLGNNPRSLTVVSSADGAKGTATIADDSTNKATGIPNAYAKVQTNLENLARVYAEKATNKTRGFITDLSRALNLTQHEASNYGTFALPNGKTLAIRISNHNALVSNFDKNNENNGISIVISSHRNKRLNNDGKAHIVEYFYHRRAIENATGKPLAEILESIKDAINSGEFKDTTGLAEREEVNEYIIREQRVYHGSGADFGHFDHSHMGEGEGAQAFGWGTYVTEVEGIGRTYAESARKKPTYLYGGKEMSSDEFHDYVQGEIGDWNENMLNDFMYNLERHGVTRAKDILKKGDLAQYKNLFYQSIGDTRNYAEGKIKAARTLLSLKGIRIRKPKSHLYTIEIPDDNGKNYLDWNGHPAESLLKDVGSFLESNGFERVQDSPARYEKGESTIVLNPNATGADLYAELQEALGSDKEASKALSEIGLTGIKYPADYIRGGREDGAKNYVIFNENDAKITDHVRFFKTKNGEAYGFTIGGKIYIDPKVATSETPVHEYAHLWASALKANNAKEWQNVVGLMKGTSVWEEVKELYPELKSDDEIADEVLATYSGRRGAERLRKEMDDIAKSNGNVFDKATAMNAMHRVKQAIEKFWKAVADFLHIHYTSAEQVADQVMKDLLDGVDPRSMMDGGKSLRPETRINIVAANTEHGFKNYAEAKTWAKEHIARTYSGEETGGKGDIRISNAAVDKYLSQSAVDKSDSKDVHLSVLKVLPDVIRESVDAEQHADYKKGEDGVRSAKNGINPNVTIHRLYGAVRMDGKVYRVKVTLKKNTRTKETPKAYSYEATKIELLEGSLSQTEGSHNLEPSNSKSEVSAGQHGNVSGLTSTFPRYSDKSITAANLLNGVEKSYGGGKFFEDYNKIREQFIGEQGAERADHAEEVSTRLDNLSVAREMENDKKDAKAIKMATGWERGADGKWRYEIPDLKYFSKGDAGYKKAREKQPWSKELDGLSDRIFDGEELSESEYQRFDELAQKEEKFKTDYLNREKPHLADWVENDELFKAYPDLKRVKMVFTDQLPVNVGGSYNDREHTIVVNTNYVGDIASILAHEVQHAIQKIEGFAVGGSPKSVRYVVEKQRDYYNESRQYYVKVSSIGTLADYIQDGTIRELLHSEDESGRTIAFDIISDGIEAYKDLGARFILDYGEYVDPDKLNWADENDLKKLAKALNIFYGKVIDEEDIENIRKEDKLQQQLDSLSDMELYKRLVGEVESRNAEHRMNMTPEERRASLAAETEDVSREDQIFLMSGDGGNANSEMPQERETEDEYSKFAKEHGVDADMVKDYASGMKTGNLQKTDMALAEIRRTMRVANRGMKLSEFGKLFRPVQKELAERYGDIETLRQEHIDAAMRERGVMEAARKRAEEEEAKRKARADELSLLSTEELDKRYFDAIESGDDAAAREMLDEAAHRKGYDDTESNYQGVGAWSAPSNPGYESDAERRADVEENAPDVNIEDIALGYSLVDEKYWQEPRKYMQTDATAIESVNAIREAIAAVRRGEKNVKVKVYRAVPTSVKEGKLRNGDWVTPSKGYAEMHGNNRLEGKYRIIEDEVPVSELWWDGNDSREWGFDDGKHYKYKNVENNRKSDELVTRDDNGDIIPPSKRFNQENEDIRFRTSEELNQEYGSRWIDEQTNEDGRHTTQVKSTLNSYKKFGDWVKKDSNRREVTVLDASSGLGLGTEWLRENGIDAEDVEPYPSENRTAPTYTSYDDVRKKYDYIISNAVLNVIPDDWRANVLHNMADKLKVGGKLVINVRGADSIRKQGKEGETRITLDDPSEILVLRPNGSIKAYQKGFTKQELKDWCEKELGDGYSVEIANNKNAGGSYDTAVVVTKNNESDTIGVASEDSHPSRSAQALPNSGAKLGNNQKFANNLSELSEQLSERGMGAHEFLYNVAKAFGLNANNLNKSYYQDLNNLVGIRISDHSASPSNIVEKNKNDEVYGLVVKLSNHRFKSRDDANYLEYVYYPDKLSGERQREIVDGLNKFLQTGDFTQLPSPDRVNRSGKFEAETKPLFRNIPTKPFMVEDYVSSVHIKRDGNLRNKIKNGAELLLPQERNTDGTLSRNNSTPTAKVENNPDTSQLSLQEKSMHQAAKAVADEMHLGGNVDVLTSTDGLTGRKKNAKGWYDPQTGRITIVLPNHNGRADVVNTMLHEAVGHYGLRELVGKENMNEFLDFVFKNADKATRSQIVHNSAKYGWDMRKATEEYMASMAEDGTFKNVNKRWWHQLKLAFLKMLHKLGFAGFSGTTLSDNDLRYLLWRSWKNLTEGPARNIYQVAEDTWRQQHLKVGDFAEPKAVDAKTREQNLYYREERERKSARDEYERSVNTAKHKMDLAWVDSMSGLKLLQDAIVPNEKDLKDWENAYMAENRMSSTNLAEMETYKKSFYKDLLDAEQELLDKGATYEQVTNYMMAKHGLERNEVLAFRDALKHDFANDKQKMSAAWKAYKNDATAQQNKTDFESGKISWDDYKANDTAIREKYAPSYKKYRSKDYSGLTELTTDDPSIKSYQDQIATLKEQLNNERDDATKKSIRIKIAKLNKEMVNEAERIAENSSSNFEKKYDTSELWNRTNAATKASLTKQYESGLLTDEVYHHTLDMFKNYIPLRGFDEVTSDEVYNYFGNAKGQFGGGIRSAKGRKSKADDPIATIGNMAESAIMQGNRNQMKQHFLKMVLNHPSDAVSVDQLYLHYDAATQEWKPVFAEFDEHDDANAVAQKVEAFNQRMETLCQQKPDEYKKASEAHDIQYKVVGKNINEHQVHVKMQGKDYVLTINGNPEAAQALNGQTNPDSTDNPFIKFFQSTNHFMAAMFTQKNPAFILSNLSRDSFYANSMVWAKESPAYAWKFNKNWGKSLYTLFGLITRQRKGTLNMNDKVDRMYQEFIENGGETGYTFLHSVDDYKNMIAKALKESRRSGWNPKSWLKFLDNLINYLGTWAENTSRFAAYRTSREMGRSIEKSIWDAKEISVNFNKKGAGAKAAGKWEDGNRLNVMQAYMSQSAKELYVFWNAGVQGLSNVSRTFGKSKGKTLAVAGLYFAIGTALPMLMAALSQGSGDDDTNYYDLPDWVRRNNLCFYTGKGWVTIPLPIELRAFYGLGELAQSVLSGNEEYTATDIATKMLEQVSQLFPVDFMEGGGSLTSFVPSYAKPIVEAYVTNKDYTGTPIYKDAEYNKNRPEWTKAYKGTNQALVWASRLLNELGGGDDVKKANVGVMDVNPAKIQHLFEGYFGGLGKFVFQTMKVASMPFNEDNRELKNVPIINSFYKTSDERTKDRAITSKFYKYNDEYQKTQELLSLYKKELQAPEYKSKFYDLMYSPEGFSATMMDSYNKQLSAVRKAMSVTDPNSDKYKELQQQQVDIQKQAVKVIEATKGVVNSEDKEMKELYNLWMQDYSNDPKKAEERSNKTIEMRKDIVKRIMDIAKQNKPQKK